MLRENEKIFGYFQRLADIFAITLSWFAAYFLRFHLMRNAQPGLGVDFVKVWLALVLISYYFFEKTGLYKSLRFQSRYSEIFNVLKANSLGFIYLIIFLYFIKTERISRVQLVTYFSISSLVLISLRIVVRNLLRSLRARGNNLRHVLLIGDGDQLDEYVKISKLYKDSGINFLGWLEDGGLADKHHITKLTTTYEQSKLHFSPDVVVISFSHKKSHLTNDFLKKHYDDVTPIQILPDLSYSLIGHEIENFGGIPLLTVNQPSFSTIELVLKRTLDFLATLVGLLLITPILLTISLMVKISSKGPIFYGQSRIGLNGREFVMWKFRSMRVAENNEDKTTWSSKNDPRKTKFGSFIRKTSLDELPQLWNVLKGDMSLVGPRPERPYFVDKFKKEIPNYMLRHKMKAGITGWAQINGWRGDTSISKRIECDIYYIKNWSFWLDLKILLLTFIKGFLNKNAY